MKDRMGCGDLLRLRGHTDWVGSPTEDGTLEIGDTTPFSCYLHGGAVTEVKRHKTVNHVSTSAPEVGVLRPLKGLLCSGPVPEPSAPCRSPWMQPCSSLMWWPRVPRKLTVPTACIRPSVHYTGSRTSVAAHPDPGIL